jgi:hypothetical protein
VIARSVRFAMAASSSVSIAVLVGFNLLPLFGDLFWGWNVETLLVLYWIENGIVGLYNIPKILLASGSDTGSGIQVTGPLAGSGPAARIGVVAFFLVHYGIFWLIHGVFVFALPAFAGIGHFAGFPGFGGFTDFQTLSDGTIQFSDPTLIEPNWSAVTLGAIGLAISHGTSFVVNFLGRREYLRVSPMRQMIAPYGRLVILHLTILFGAFVSLAIGSPIGAIVVLVLLKTGLDLWLHLREHGRFQLASATG